MPTKIEWAEETWNPTLGCSKSASGCQNCYAISHVNRLAGNPKFGEVYQGLVEWRNGRLNWTGKVRVNPARLHRPAETRKPTIWFVNSLSDLFHPNLDPVLRDVVFHVMRRANWHHYLLLTKHPVTAGIHFSSSAGRGDDARLPHVHFGLSASKQADLDGLVQPFLLIDNRGMLFLSLEPLLGPIDLADLLRTGRVGWVITGHESGHRRRVCNEDWVRQIRDACVRFNVPFFYKQAVRNGEMQSLPELDGRVWDQTPWQLGVRHAAA